MQDSKEKEAKALRNTMNCQYKMRNQLDWHWGEQSGLVGK